MYNENEFEKNESRLEKIIINEEDVRIDNKKTKKGNSSRKFIATAMIAVIGCGSLGLGIGAGSMFAQKISNTLFGSKSESSTANLDVTSSVAQTMPFIEENNGIEFTTSIELSNNRTIPNVIAAVEDAVVSIRVTVPSNQSFFGRNFSFENTGAGSGIIFAEDDEKIYIVTNNHVIDSATAVTISIDDAVETRASYVGSDASYDIAVISVLKSDLIENSIHDVTVAKFGDSDSVMVGETVIAIGNALGEGKSATLGIVSALDRNVNIDGNNMKFLQTDAAINSGNSGGPLVDGNATVIGINTAKFSSYSIEGMGLSIPINTVKGIINDILENGTVERPGIGITGMTLTEELKDGNDFPDGVLVLEVLSGGAADIAGMRIYDIITEFDGVSIKAMEDLTQALAERNVGDVVMLTVNRSVGNTVSDRVLYLTIQDLNAGTF